MCITELPTAAIFTARCNYVRNAGLL